MATSLKNVVAFGPVRLALAILIGALLAAIVGVLIGIPVLRLQGDYLAIVTLAFGEIIKNILNCLYVGVDAKGLHFSMTDPTIGMGGHLCPAGQDVPSESHNKALPYPAIRFVRRR